MKVAELIAQSDSKKCFSLVARFFIRLRRMTTALAVEECVTPESNTFYGESAMLRRITLSGG